MPSKTRRPDYSEQPESKTDWAALDAMSDDEVEAAAIADPDAPPLRPGQRMRRMARAKRIRLDLGLSAVEFASRYHIPASVLEGWERHAIAPDAVALAFLDAIAADPEAIARALAQARGEPAVAE